MWLVLAAIPIFCLLALLFLYPHNGKREILKLDLVQFVYSMVIFPLLFVWVKSFFYFLLRHELNLSLSQNEVFALDSFLSVAMLYTYAFVIIHSLTKTFNLRYFHDPLYDIIEHSEWFHLWLSHLVIYSGAAVVLLVISITNVLVPMQFYGDITLLYTIMVVGVISGIFAYGGLWLSDPKQGYFLRIMKLVIAGMFAVQVFAFYWVRPGFNLSYAAFWCIFTLNLTMVIASFIFERSRRTARFFDRFKHDLWEDAKIFVMKPDKKRP